MASSIIDYNKIFYIHKKYFHSCPKHAKKFSRLLSEKMQAFASDELFMHKIHGLMTGTSAPSKGLNLYITKEEIAIFWPDEKGNMLGNKISADMSYVSDIKISHKTILETLDEIGEKYSKRACCRMQMGAGNSKSEAGFDVIEIATGNSPIAEEAEKEIDQIDFYAAPSAVANVGVDEIDFYAAPVADDQEIDEVDILAQPVLRIDSEVDEIDFICSVPCKQTIPRLPLPEGKQEMENPFFPPSASDDDKKGWVDRSDARKSAKTFLSRKPFIASFKLLNERKGICEVIKNARDNWYLRKDAGMTRLLFRQLSVPLPPFASKRAKMHSESIRFTPLTEKKGAIYQIAFSLELGALMEWKRDGNAAKVNMPRIFCEREPHRIALKGVPSEQKKVFPIPREDCPTKKIEPRKVILYNLLAVWSTRLLELWKSIEEIAIIL